MQGPARAGAARRVVEGRTVIDLQAEAIREEYALRLGLPADSHPADVLQALINMTEGDVWISQLAAITREMGGQLSIDLVRRTDVETA